MTSLRFQVTYARTVLGSYETEMFQREMFAASYAEVEKATTRLPRWVETVAIERILPETAAETAARVRRENAGPVPYGC